MPSDAAPQIGGMSIEKATIKVMYALRDFLQASPDPRGVAPVGGEIRLWEVSAAGISERTIHKFEDHEQTAAAVRARVQREGLGYTTAEGLLGGEDLLKAQAELEAKTPLASSPATVAAGDGMSRQQRRQMERQARRRA
jgi:hypothetical protein